jgi:probable F420-dependent oxidoreductase
VARVKVGAVFPQTEIEPQAGAIREWAEAVAELGYDHVLVYDHVTGVDPAVHPDWAAAARRGGATRRRPYDVSDRFHEVMVLLGFLAAVCDLELVTGVLVLPQRQAALAAKQAAEVDLLCEGRLRLGLGTGWNALEFRSLGREFADRGARLDEQIELLRRYWCEPSVSFEGRWEWADGVGIAPAPPQRPIPIWIGAGAGSRRALDRVGRLGDGWLPVEVDPGGLGDALDQVRESARGSARDPEAIGIQGRTEGFANGEPASAAEQVEGWRRFGATHVAVNLMGQGLNGGAAHASALAEVAAALSLGAVAHG